MTNVLILSLNNPSTVVCWRRGYSHFPPLAFPLGLTVAATVAKTALAAWLLLTAWLMYEAKAAIRIPTGRRNSGLRADPVQKHISTREHVST